MHLILLYLQYTYYNPVENPHFEGAPVSYRAVCRRSGVVLHNGDGKEHSGNLDRAK